MLTFRFENIHSLSNVCAYFKSCSRLYSKLVLVPLSRERWNRENICARSSSVETESGQVDSLRVKRVYMYIYTRQLHSVASPVWREDETDAVGETEVRLNHCFWAAVNFRFRFHYDFRALHALPFSLSFTTFDCYWCRSSTRDQRDVWCVTRSDRWVWIARCRPLCTKCSIFPFVHKYIYIYICVSFHPIFRPYRWG